ncbi:hypothetical protein HS088_TW04G01184 [Tripterygium wilfordii]|uniref:Uncharacterized protein n=1 Tax=Tripterygium wilfordii TaxID=458696 RepID=A0A7J7DS77_TRIWF|nr:hypothetical protein HS088_TW04G01184 [Tripterygium wilfordii]
MLLFFFKFRAAIIVKRIVFLFSVIEIFIWNSCVLAVVVWEIELWRIYCCNVSISDHRLFYLPWNFDAIWFVILFGLLANVSHSLCMQKGILSLVLYMRRVCLLF